MFMNKTLKDLLESPLIADIAPEAISKRDLTQEEFYTWTLQEIADRMGWRNLNPALPGFSGPRNRAGISSACMTSASAPPSLPKAAPVWYGCLPATPVPIRGPMYCWCPAAL